MARHEEGFFPTARHKVGPDALMARSPAAVLAIVEAPVDHLLAVVGEEVEPERASNMSKLISRSMASNSKTRAYDLKETLLTASPPMVSKDL